jgi:L,D-peptidoglycan transpeptidase YkuD (ErfK/YbiS/YcfS/YnhG family)
MKEEASHPVLSLFRLVAPALLLPALVFVALTGTAQAQAPKDADERVPTGLVLRSTPEVVDYGGSAMLSGRLSTSDTVVAAATLVVSSSRDGLLWSAVSSVSTDAQGDFSVGVTPTASYGRTIFSVAFAGSDTLQPAVAQLAVGSRVALGAPSAPLSVGRGSAFTFAGSLQPTPLAAAAAVTVSCSRSTSAGQWVLLSTVTAPLLSAVNGSIYSQTLSLPRAGSWRLRASYVDEVHELTWSTNSTVVHVGAQPDLPIWNRDGVVTLPERMASRQGAEQLVVATGPRLGAHYGTLSLFEYRAGDWIRVTSAPARFGANGLTDGRTRQAGNRTTPTGIWRMPLSFFGTHAGPPSGAKMAYRRITPRSWWSSEDNATYNTWVETTRRVDGEHLADYPTSYELAVSSGYNALPNECVYGRGAGIFLHVNSSGLTAGCISVARRDMIRVCRWLDPAKQPACAVGTTRAGTATSIYAQ